MYMYKRSARIDHYTTCKSIIFLQKKAVYFVFYFPKSIFLRCKAALIISGAPARAKRASSGAPWVRKFGKLSIPENLVMT